MRKYKNINHFVRVYSINSTFHDTAMGVGQLYNGTMENRFGKNGSGCGLADPLPHTIQRREARYGEHVLR